MTQPPDLLFLLHDTARLLRHEADRRAGVRGMTRAQWVTLFWLERQPGLSQKELAELLEVEPITAARLIDRLQARGMVERRPDSHDRRIWRLHLCPPAEPVLAEMHGEGADILRMATRGLDEAALAKLREGLSHMKATLLCECRKRPQDKAPPLKTSDAREIV